jgi:hypothetical protein
VSYENETVGYVVYGFIVATAVLWGPFWLLGKLTREIMAATRCFRGKHEWATYKPELQTQGILRYGCRQCGATKEYKAKP